MSIVITGSLCIIPSGLTGSLAQEIGQLAAVQRPREEPEHVVHRVVVVEVLAGRVGGEVRSSGSAWKTSPAPGRPEVCVRR